MYCIFFRRLWRPKYFRTVIEGGGAGWNYCCRTKKEQIQYAKVSSATASAHWDQRKLYSEIESQTQLDDGWPESEKDVFQAALRMVVVKGSR